MHGCRDCKFDCCDDCFIEHNKKLKTYNLHMAPEYFTANNWSFEYDIWSLGVILYRLITLRYPFDTKEKTLECFYNKDLVQDKDLQAVIGKIF